MADCLNNCFLVNAPAGSGKTTYIKGMVRDIISAHVDDNVLCITYTNRAADELSSGFSSENVTVGTIHSFLNVFMQKYFSNAAVLDLYFKTYEDDIEARIANSESKENIAESNARYIESYGSLDISTVRSNITALHYNESQFMSLFYGGLSHDELLRFSRIFLDTYPIAAKGLGAKYQHVFVDEFQDTSADVLRIIYSSFKDTGTNLYLFGDRMQQIYKNYDGSFEQQLSEFDTGLALKTNYRSQPSIVKLLNNIYNDKKLAQQSSKELGGVSANCSPQLVITRDVETIIEESLSARPDTLVLRLLNKERFSAIGALELYESVSHMEKYKFGSKYSSANVLTTNSSDNPDPFFKLLFLVAELNSEFVAKRYGVIIKALKTNHSMFDRSSCHLERHADKQLLFSKLSIVFSCLNDRHKTIGDLIEALLDNALLNKYFATEIASDRDYDNVLTVETSQLLNVLAYQSKQTVSTQHGVKGESHESVLFVVEDSKRIPIVSMYRLFDMWTKIDISLNEFQSFYYSYAECINSLETNINTKVSNLKADSYQANSIAIKSTIGKILDTFGNNPYFQFLCLEEYNVFIEKDNVTSLKNCLKESAVYGVLAAYKLFYVGCSRARERLTVLIDERKVQGVLEAQKQKFTQLGFEVTEK